MARKKVKTAKRKKKSSEVDLLRVISKDSELSLISDMEDTTFFPTMLTGYNRATGIGGHPRKRITVIHGPPQVGKSVLALALAESARRWGHAPVIFDSEFASEKEWYNSISPRSGIEYPIDLDGMREKIYEMFDNLQKAKKIRKATDRISEEAGCFIVVDTITELYPRNVLDKIKEEGIDKMYPYQALWIGVWMKEVVPILTETNSSIVLVMQERKKMNTMPGERKWRLPGGDSIQYGNCLRVRVKFQKKVEISKKVVGSQPHFIIENNKIDGTTYEKGTFFTSNGRGDMPKGLDLVREVIEEAKEREWLKKEKEAISVEAPGLVYEVEGGWSDLREFLMENPREFKKLVKKLNFHARRQ